MAGLRKDVLAGFAFALTHLAGCASLDKMEADFEQTWERPAVEVTPSEPSPAAAMNEKSFGELEAKLAGMSENECRSIIRIAARMLAYKADYAPAELKWAGCDYSQGDFVAARTRYLRIVDAASAASIAPHTESGSTFEAETEAETQLRVKIKAQALQGIGLSELHLGNKVDARRYLRLADESGGASSADVANTLGFLDDQDQRWQDAERYYLRAAELAPNDGSALNNLGMSYMRQQRYIDAATAFARSVRAQPDLQVARLNLRIAQAMAGSVTSALSGASESDKAVVMNNLGVAALARGDRTSAKAYFEAALNFSPSFYSNAYANLELAGTPRE